MDSTEPPKILIVIPTLNEAKTIKRVIEDLSVDLPTNYSVLFVVVDGGSIDGTVEIVESMCKTRNDLHLIENPKRIQAAGINLAVNRFAQLSEIFIRCDAHMIYPHGFIGQLTETLHRVRADSVTIVMDSIGDTCFQKAVGWVSDTLLGSGGSAHRGGRKSGFVDHGHHAAFLVKSFRFIGGYDESVTHVEDAELDCRLGKCGGKIYLDAKIRTKYYPRANIQSLWKQYFNYGRGRARTVSRHPRSIRARQFAVPAYFCVMYLAFMGAWAEPNLLVIPAVYFGILCAGSIVIAADKRSLCGLFAGPAAFTMHFAWASGFHSALILDKLIPKLESKIIKPSSPAG